MATPNYGYEKRQKELAKKRKKEDKLKAKAERRTDGPGDTPTVTHGDDSQDPSISHPADGPHQASD